MDESSFQVAQRFTIYRGDAKIPAVVVAWSEVLKQEHQSALPAANFRGILRQLRTVLPAIFPGLVKLPFPRPPKFADSIRAGAWDHPSIVESQHRLPSHP